MRGGRDKARPSRCDGSADGRRTDLPRTGNGHATGYTRAGNGRHTDDSPTDGTRTGGALRITRPTANGRWRSGRTIYHGWAAVQLGGLVVATIAALIVIPAAGMALSARSRVRRGIVRV